MAGHTPERQRLARLYHAAVAALGSDAEARRWLCEPQPSLGDRIPGEMTGDDDELDEAMRRLGGHDER